MFRSAAVLFKEVVHRILRETKYTLHHKAMGTGSCNFNNTLHEPVRITVQQHHDRFCHIKSVLKMCIKKIYLQGQISKLKTLSYQNLKSS